MGTWVPSQCKAAVTWSWPLPQSCFASRGNSLVYKWYQSSCGITQSTAFATRAKIRTDGSCQQRFIALIQSDHFALCAQFLASFFKDNKLVLHVFWLQNSVRPKKYVQGITKQQIYTQSLCCACCNAPCQFIPRLNLRSLVFRLTVFDWVLSITLLLI